MWIIPYSKPYRICQILCLKKARMQTRLSQVLIQYAALKQKSYAGKWILYSIMHCAAGATTKAHENYSVCLGGLGGSEGSGGLAGLGCLGSFKIHTLNILNLPNFPNLLNSTQTFSCHFVVAPKAQRTQSSRSQTLWSFEADGVMRSVERLHTILPPYIIFMFGKIEARTTGKFITYFCLWRQSLWAIVE